MPTSTLEDLRRQHSSTYQPKATSPYQYWAQVERVIDGDTIDVSVALGFEIQVSGRVRLLGVDTPEIFGVKKGSPEYEAGSAVFAQVQGILRPGTWIELKVYDGKGREKYGRWLAEVFVNGQSLNELLIEKGFASE